MPRAIPVGCGVVVFSLVPLIVAAAQIPRQSVQVEARGDVLASRWTSGQAGIGVSLPAGIYVRTGFTAGVGAGARGAESRFDLFSRFSLDPFRESRWAPYGGGGLSERFARRDSPQARTYLLLFAGVEGPILGSSARGAGWTPAFELGLGGGVRAGFALRRAIRGRR